MNAFSMTKDQITEGLKAAEAEGIDANAYSQAMLWNLLQLYRSLGRKEADIRDEISYAIDNLEDDGTFHVSRN